MTRRPLISANWKMNHNHFEAIQTMQKLAYLVPKELTEAIDVSIHPPFTDLRSLQTLIDADKLPFALGAQHCHWEDKGPYTGEVSPAFLAKLDVAYVVCGHSERREQFGETDDMVAAKITAVQRHGMVPIAASGRASTSASSEDGQGARPDRQRHRRADEGADRLDGRRLRADLGDRHRTDGDGDRRPDGVRGDPGTCGPRHRPGDRRHRAHPVRRVGQLRNIAELMAEADIDGALVGGASLDPDEFAKILTNAVGH